MLVGSLVGALGAGLVAATGRATLSLAVVGAAIVAGVTIVGRRHLAPVLWAGVAFTAPLQGVRVAPILAVSDVLLVAAVVTILPDALRGWRRVVPPGVLISFCSLIAAGIIGTFFAPDVGASLVNLFKIVLAAAGSVVAIALWDPGEARLRQFAWLWFAGASVSAAWATVTPRSFVGRAIGFTTHPNHFGLVCVLGVGLGLGLALSSSGPARLAAVAGVILQISGTGLSGSRSALIALVLTVGVITVLTRRFRLLIAVVIVLILGAMVVIVGLVHIPDSNALSRIGGGGGSAASDEGRRVLAAEAIASITRHPLGEGFEFAQAAHNIYVQVLVVGGAMALVSFLLVSGLLLRAGLRAASAARRRREGPVLAGLTAGYVGYLGSGAFENILWDRYLWTYISLLVVLAASTRSAPAGDEGVGPAWPPVQPREQSKEGGVSLPAQRGASGQLPSREPGEAASEFVSQRLFGARGDVDR